MIQRRHKIRYRGESTKRTSRLLKDILPKFQSTLHSSHLERADLLLEQWPKIIGPRYSSMTKAERFEDGILFVRVYNAILYSLLCQHEKRNLLQRLRENFPKVTVRNITFRMG